MLNTCINCDLYFIDLFHGRPLVCGGMGAGGRDEIKRCVGVISVALSCTTVQPALTIPTGSCRAVSVWVFRRLCICSPCSGVSVCRLGSPVTSQGVVIMLCKAEHERQPLGREQAAQCPTPGPAEGRPPGSLRPVRR